MSIKIAKTHFWVLLWALWDQNAIFMGPRNIILSSITHGLPYISDFFFLDLLNIRQALYNKTQFKVFGTHKNWGLGP